MKRLPEIQEESAQDSFLDVIANLVGVIIILVMLVGTKATRDVLKSSEVIAPSVAASPEKPWEGPPIDQTLNEKLLASRNDAIKSKAEVEKLATQWVRMRQETADYDKERITLAMHVSAIEQDIARRRTELDSEKQKEFDVQRRIAQSHIKLDELTQQQLSLLNETETVEELESIPTPLAREVDENSVHLRLKDGLVSVVPLNQLAEEAKNHFEDIGRRLQSSNLVTETYGPIDGYRIRVTVRRETNPADIGGPRAGHISRSTFDFSAEILPTSEHIGQDVETALMPGGAVHTYLQTQRRTSPAVVVWMYTDSFDDFRLLKRTIWEMGFSLATRPLPNGLNIGLSPHGTKAAAQ